MLAPPQSSGSIGLAWGLNICLSNKFSGDTDAIGQGLTDQKTDPESDKFKINTFHYPFLTELEQVIDPLGSQCTLLGILTD